MKKLLMSFLMAALMLGIFLMPQIANAGEKWGTKIGEYKGVPAYSNESLTHSSPSDTYGLKYQCVEYVNRFYATAMGHHNMKASGDAEDYYPTASQRKLVAYPNKGSVKPQINDILCLKGKTYGHIAIVREVTNDKVYVIQQNWNNASSDNNFPFEMEAANGKYTVKEKSGFTCQGWLRKQTTTPPDKTLVLVDGAIYWFQNSKLYHVLSLTTIKEQAGIPGWESYPSYPSLNYPKGPKFISTNADSDGLLIRQYKGDGRVYRIKDGARRRVAGPSVVTHYGLDSDNIIDVCDKIMGDIPEDPQPIILPTDLEVSSDISFSGTPYHVGDKITVDFTIKNKRDIAVKLEKLCASGRKNGGDTPYDWSSQSNITLPPNGTYQYKETKSFSETGEYGVGVYFFAKLGLDKAEWYHVGEQKTIKIVNAPLPPSPEPVLCALVVSSTYDGNLSPSCGSHKYQSGTSILASVNSSKFSLASDAKAFIFVTILFELLVILLNPSLKYLNKE